MARLLTAEWAERIEAKLDRIEASLAAIAGSVPVDIGGTLERPKVPITEAIPLELEDGTVYVAPQRDTHREFPKAPNRWAEPETAYEALAAARKALRARDEGGGGGSMSSTANATTPSIANRERDTP